MSDIMTLIKDEQRHYSMSRVLVFVWTVVIIAMLVVNSACLTQPLLTFLSSVYLFLCSWAAGPRIAQYLGPQIGSIASAIGQSKASLNSTDLKEGYDNKTTTTKEVG
jgi:hypothetical protein